MFFVNKKIFYVPILTAVFAFVFFGQTNGDFWGARLAFGYGGGGGGGSVGAMGGGIWHNGEGEQVDYKPQSSFNSPLIVAGTQEGNLIYSFQDGKTFSLNVPVGSVDARTAFMVFESNNNAPVKGAVVDLMGEKVFRLGAIDEKGNSPANFKKNLTATIFFPVSFDSTENLGLYYFDRLQSKWFRHVGAVMGKDRVYFLIGRPLSLAVFRAPGLPESLDADYYVGQGEVLGAVKFFFRKDLKLGAKNNDVSELQKRLKDEVGYNGLIGGYYGPLTETFVKKYQKQKGLVVTGALDANTRTKLNASEVKGVNIAASARSGQTQDDETKEKIISLQARVLILLRELKKNWQK